MTSRYLNILVRQGKLRRVEGKCRSYIPVGGQWIRPQKFKAPSAFVEKLPKQG